MTTWNESRGIDSHWLVRGRRQLLWWWRSEAKTRWRWSWVSNTESCWWWNTSRLIYGRWWLISRLISLWLMIWWLISLKWIVKWSTKWRFLPHFPCKNLRNRLWIINLLSSKWRHSILIFLSLKMRVIQCLQSIFNSM